MTAVSYLESLQEAVKKLHDCEAKHVKTVPVIEDFQGARVWEGNVEVFELSGHEKAKTCYAWSYKRDDGKTLYIAVLELPPVDSARKAVQVAITSGQQK